MFICCALPVLGGCSLFSNLKSDEEGNQVQKVVIREGQVDSNSSQPAISEDGSLIAFASDATNLVRKTMHGERAVYLKNVQKDETSLISSDEDGRPADNDSEHPAISADGRYVAFESRAGNLVSQDLPSDCIDENGLDSDCTQIYLKDLDSGDVKLVSSDSDGAPAEGINGHASISEDGRYVAFVSSASNLVADDENGRRDIFIKDTHTSEVRMASVSEEGEAADGDSDMPSISADGRLVAFKSVAENLSGKDFNNASDVFVKNMDTGDLAIASSDVNGNPGNKASGYDALDISSDGRFVAFESEATELVGDDVNGKRDIFIKNLESGEVVLASADAEGAPGDDDSYESVSLSSDGLLVAFSSNAENLVSGDEINKEDVFIKNMVTGEVTMVSADSTGSPGNGESVEIKVSGDGNSAAFVSQADNLVADDTNAKADVFIKYLVSGDVILASTASPD